MNSIMSLKETDNRNFYKSMVIGMSICLPAGVGIGFVKGSISLGLLTGNAFGIILGLLISAGLRNKKE